MKRNIGVWWFLLGLGAKLQLIASLSMTEAVVLVVAPFLIPRSYDRMRRDGISAYFWVSFLLVIGCAISSACNGSEFPAVLRGLAVTSLLWLSVPFCYTMLTKAPDTLKWFFLGIAVSNVVSTFFFQSAYEMAEYGGNTEAIMSGPIYWISRMGQFLFVPGRGWYLETPLWISILAPIFLAGFAMLTTTSGRSAALGAMATAIICLIGRKKVASMRFICRNFYLLLVVAVVSVFAVNGLYRFTATKGFLGEAAQKKYESQTRGGTSVGKLLMGGRAESFVGLLACRDNPIVGLGPWARDENGYVQEFLMDYGQQEDYEAFLRMQAKGSGGIGIIPCHSYVTCLWMWYGILGLVYVLYVLFVMIRFLKDDCATVPQWFYWLAAGVPGTLWMIFFSAVAERFTLPLFICGCLIARAVRKRTYNLPRQMLERIR